MCVLEGGNTKATVVSGPSNLNTSSLREPGWYFFKPLKSSETKSLSPNTALHMMEEPSAGIQSYLQTHAFKGIGPETARKLAVPETYNVFEDLSRPAEEISVAYGINASTATLFETAWAKTSKTRDIQIMLRQLGLGNAVVKQIRETLGNDVIEEILSNPYELVKKIKYFTFEDAENIVAGLNLDLSSDQRIISAMELCLYRIEKDRGHTCAPLERAFKDNDKLIEFDHDIIEGVLAQESTAGIHIAAIGILITPTTGDIKILQCEAKRVQSRMTTGAIGALTMLGKFFTNGEFFVGSILIERRHIVGWRRGWIVENDLNNPCATGNWMGTFRAIIHGKHGSTGDNATVAGILYGHAVKGGASKLVAHLIVISLARALLDLADIFFLWKRFKGLIGFAQRILQSREFLLLYVIHGLQGIGFGDKKILTGSRGSNFLWCEGPVV